MCAVMALTLCPRVLTDVSPDETQFQVPNDSIEAKFVAGLSQNVGADRVLRFPDGAMDMNKMNPRLKAIYCRGVYRDLYKQLVNGQEEQSYVLGQPGIGKSLFRVYVAHKLARQHGDCNMLFQKCSNENCPILVVKKRGTQLTALSFKRSAYDKVQSLVDGAWKGVRSISLVDVSYGMTQPPVDTDRTIYFSSPNEKILRGEKERSKDMRFRTYYMPLWTLEELKAANKALKANLDAMKVEERFYKYGGVGRAVFGKTSADPHQSYDAEEKLTKALEGVSSQGLNKALDKQDGALLSSNASHCLVKVDATADFKAKGETFVSQYVLSRVVEAWLHQGYTEVSKELASQVRVSLNVHAVASH